MNNETTPPFTSERDKACDEICDANFVYEHNDAMRSEIHDAFCLGADWGHARASEEIASLTSQLANVTAAADLQASELTRADELLAASQAREEGLRAERDAYAKAMALALREGIFANKAKVSREIEALLAAHGGGEKDE